MKPKQLNKHIKYSVDALGGHPEVLLDEVEGHGQGNQGEEEERSDGGNDPDGRQAEQRGPRQGLQRGRNVLREDNSIHVRRLLLPLLTLM